MSPKTISPRRRAALLGLAGLLLVVGGGWAGEEPKVELVLEEVGAKPLQVPSGQAFIIQGIVRNKSDSPVSKIKIRASLHTRTQRSAVIREAYAGRALTDHYLKASPKGLIELLLDLPYDANASPQGVRSGGAVYFTIVFFDPPDCLTQFTLTPISAQPHLTATAKPQPPSQYDRLLDSVVVVRNEVGRGSGFFISKKGLLVTNSHVVGDNLSVTIRLRNGKELVGKVVETRPDLDLALIDINEHSPNWLRLASPNEGGVGEEVMAIGAPIGLFWSVSRGIISGIRDEDPIRYIQTDAALNSGNSGGPLILIDSGRVVGANTITYFKFLTEGISLAVSADNIREAFSEHLPDGTEATIPGCDTRWAQEILNRMGFYLKTDGKFGPQTSAVIRKYQVQNGLEATGLLDEDTCLRLDQHARDPLPPKMASETPDPIEALARLDPTATADFKIGSAAYLRRDYAAALRQFVPLAMRNHVFSQFLIGVMYTAGLGLPLDYAKAAKWFRLAAEQGHREARNALGDLHYFGKGMDVNYTEAAFFYRQAAEDGHAMAQNKLGALYAAGLGVCKDLALASIWYRKSAELGYAEAQFNLAAGYLLGEGVVKNETEGVKWFTRAAAQGLARAQAMLGSCYWFGNGVSRDLVKAHMWLSLAVDQGLADAPMYLKRVAQRMTPAQIEEARRLAREWKPRKEWP